MGVGLLINLIIAGTIVAVVCGGRMIWFVNGDGEATTKDPYVRKPWPEPPKKRRKSAGQIATIVVLFTISAPMMAAMCAAATMFLVIALWLLDMALHPFFATKDSPFFLFLAIWVPMFGAVFIALLKDWLKD
jgi:hypothetical protein